MGRFVLAEQTMALAPRCSSFGISDLGFNESQLAQYQSRSEYIEIYSSDFGSDCGYPQPYLLFQKL